VFAVTVSFRIRPGSNQRFLALMHDNAAASLALEPGCRQFDVCTDPARPDDVFLYEIYDSAAAFEAHLHSAHFRAFEGAIADMVASKQVLTYGEVRQ
jgi:quinol monooxygenase YgiN